MGIAEAVKIASRHDNRMRLHKVVFRQLDVYKPGSLSTLSHITLTSEIRLRVVHVVYLTTTTKDGFLLKPSRNKVFNDTERDILLVLGR